MKDALERFVAEGLARGHGKSVLREKLAAAGWPADEVEEALAVYADLDFDVPVPRPKPYVSARDAFQYLVAFTLLYVAAWSLGRISFDVINRWFPIGTEQVWQIATASSTRWAAAALIVSFPLFLWFSRRIRVATRRDPVQRTSKVRQWLTYLTMFVAACVAVGDVVAVLYRLLEGDPTARFLLKTLVVALIAGTVLAYYLWELRSDERGVGAAEARRGVRLLAGAVSAAVIAVLVVGLSGISGPARARAERFDTARVAHLRQIAAAVDDHWQDEATLPPDLDTLASRRGVAIVLEDPQTGERYRYEPLEAPEFRLCADFLLEDREATAVAVATTGVGLERFWHHPAGRHCFTLRARERE
ncbi:MAG TPA: DUF5671 domain-containing protein [Thermoanaerobaculia bacterium]|nr:DUF5671 domain-containing protein [Thermoanaerobaculia bacterium]